MADLKMLTLKVMGEQKIHCAGCENNIQRALTRMPGVQSVKADHRTQRIEINVENEPNILDQIKAKLDWMGYAAREE